MPNSSPRFLGERLTEAREALGLTVAALGELLNKSRETIYQYERGDIQPSPEVRHQIEKLLGQPSYFFTHPLPPREKEPTLFFRSMRSTEQSARRRLETHHKWLREIVLYLQQYIELPKVNFPDLDIPDNPALIANDDIEDYARELRRFWRLGDQPIPHMIRLLEANGVVVARNRLDAPQLDAVSAWLVPEGRPTVILNSDKTAQVRSRFDAAHELAHLILHRKVTQELLKDKVFFEMIERQAHYFANAFLLPKEPFLEDLYSISLDILIALKSKWRVSVAAMLERIRALGIIDHQIYVKYRTNYLKRGWRTGEPFDTEWELEQPVLLQRAFQLLIQQGIASPGEIKRAIGKSETVLAELANLPEHLLRSDDLKLRVLRFDTGGELKSRK